jgi:hypothetical protein
MCVILFFYYREGSYDPSYFSSLSLVDHGSDLGFLAENLLLVLIDRFHQLIELFFPATPCYSSEIRSSKIPLMKLPLFNGGFQIFKCDFYVLIFDHKLLRSLVVRKSLSLARAG